MNDSIKTFLADLKEINEKNCVDILVPSLDKLVSFKSLSVKQHKDIVKSLLSGMEGTILVTKVLNDIIKENSTVQHDFKLYDRNKILVELRRQNISDSVTIDDKKFLLTDLPTFKKPSLDTTTLNYKGIEVKLRVPSLEVDSKITEKSVVDISKFSTDEKKVGISLGILLTYEIIKFVETLQVEDVVINFDELGTYDKKSVIENLPLKLNNDILEFITTYKQQEQELFTFSDGTKLEIDGSFLTSE